MGEILFFPQLKDDVACKARVVVYAAFVILYSIVIVSHDALDIHKIESHVEAEQSGIMSTQENKFGPLVGDGLLHEID